MIYEINSPEDCFVKASSEQEAVRHAAEFLDWGIDEFEFWPCWNEIPESAHESLTEFEIVDKYCLPHVEAKHLSPGDTIQIDFDVFEDAPKAYQPYREPQTNKFHVPCSVLDEVHDDPEVVCAERWAP